MLLALESTRLWNRSCVVVVSVLENSSASISAEISIAMLEEADQLLVDFGAIILPADRGFPCADLLRWFDGKSRWQVLSRMCNFGARVSKMPICFSPTLPASKSMSLGIWSPTLYPLLISYGIMPICSAANSYVAIRKEAFSNWNGVALGIQSTSMSPAFPAVK